MNIWIDIEDASGQRYGDGPITTATEWRSTRRLDRAGTFSFQMPAADPRAQYLAHKRIVRCWTVDGNGLRELGAGVIERISIQRPADGATMLEISGDDLLRELAHRTVGDLKLYDDVTYTPAALFFIVDPDPGGLSHQVVLPDDIDLTINPLGFLYIEHTEPWAEMRLTITSGNQQTAGMAIQYWNAGSHAWERLSNIVDGTVNHGVPLTRSGTIKFTAPAAWGPDPNTGRYQIRMATQDANLDPFHLTAVTLTIGRPIDDALARIMALAPPGWTLDPAGQIATASTVYMALAGESVLTALVKLAEQTGEHFVRSPAGRRILWLGTAQYSSGLQAIQISSPGSDTMALIDLSRTSDSYEQFTRIYPYGGGAGAARLTLQYTTQSRPGYYLSAAANYLERTDAVALYGRIDKREDFPDIAPSDMSRPQIINAANSLFDRAWQTLRRRAHPQYAYKLSVIPAEYPLYPGQTIHVVYHEWVDGYHAVAIDTIASNEPLWVLEVTQSIGPDGILIVDPVVATIDFWPDTDSRAVAKTMGDVQLQRAVELPQEGYTDTAYGVPVDIKVINGQVVSVTRVIPIADDTHDTTDIIKTQSGIIVDMWDEFD